MIARVHEVFDFHQSRYSEPKARGHESVAIPAVEQFLGAALADVARRNAMCIHWLTLNVLTDSSFGLTIAYLLPGFTSLWGLAALSPTIRTWLGTPSAEAPSLGGFLYVTIASLTAGLILSTLRWLVLDWIHNSTGLKTPKRDFSRLQEQGSAFSILVSDLYRYYQFYGNMMFAVAFTYGVWRLYGQPPFGSLWTDVLAVLLELLLLAGSRDTLRNYYERSRQVLAVDK